MENRQNYLNWLDGKPAELGVILAIRSALRLLPSSFVQNFRPDKDISGIDRSLLHTLQAIAISRSLIFYAGNLPILAQHAVHSARLNSEYSLVSETAHLALISAFWSLQDYSRSKHAASFVFASRESLGFGDDDFFQSSLSNLKSDCEFYVISGLNWKKMLEVPLWNEGSPAYFN